ncbi:MAG: mannose-6-phosphate isomerase, class I [Victivallales bacterium]|nr:mannose-6-phosphate isomerase, class I [Victivallales bacterium]
MNTTAQIYSLESGVQHYAWGCRSHDGQKPYIADLLDQPAGNTPWAELWIGAHPSLCSQIVVDGKKEPLSDFIAENPQERLGKMTLDAGFQELPFLLKILSCERALSIQSHPDKKSAERLHNRSPRKYPDDNHKPEIMIALTPFKAMAGFRKAEDALQDLNTLSCIHYWRQVYEAAMDITPRVLCETLLNLPSSIVRTILTDLQKELESKEKCTERENLVLNLIKQNPCDRGVLFGFLLNIIELKPGEFLYIPPNEPHAYLGGTGVECMANSDNVIRAGLTPKFIDIRALLATLTFSSETVSSAAPQKEGDGVRLYASPAREYEVRIFDDIAVDFSERSGVPGVLLVLSGAYELAWPGGQTVVAQRGSSWFFPASLTTATAKPLEKGSELVMATVPRS